MSLEPELRLLVELEAEAARWRRRTMFLFSVILHGVLIGLLLFAPQIFRRGAEMMGINLTPVPKRETTFLLFPPDLLKRMKEPPPDTSILSDKNRRAQGRSPIIDPHGLRMPYSRGNTPLPEIAGGGKPTPPPAPPPTPPPGGASSPSAPPAASAPAPKKENEEARLQLMDVRPEPAGGSASRLHLPLSSPGDANRQAAQAAARGLASGALSGPGDSPSQLQNFHPNFSTEAPVILSDTRGVDFGPYLARIVYDVRRNWYAVIPESARLGEKGRVAVVFEILKDGSVPQLRVVSSSGQEPLDLAALSSIHASTPFPPLPSEFTGNHLVLEFIFLYNMGYATP